MISRISSSSLVDKAGSKVLPPLLHSLVIMSKSWCMVCESGVMAKGAQRRRKKIIIDQRLDRVRTKSVNEGGQRVGDDSDDDDAGRLIGENEALADVDDDEAAAGYLIAA